MESISRQLKKGVVDILLLTLVDKRAMYGYELMTMLDKASGGYFAVREGTLYPVLYRLEDAGFITSEWSQAETARRGAPRKYYTITEAGRAHLAAAREELAAFLRGIERILEGSDITGGMDDVDN